MPKLGDTVSDECIEKYGVLVHDLPFLQDVL
jgi:hypothetical protein